ncbi:hypothetical protein DITRI_Ditri01bG0174300 [Diplodiscus trichospermus]
MAKKGRMEDADRISNLPDEIISHILSFLSTKEAVRTSILSTRWRYCFAFVSNLDFELIANLRLSPKKRNRLTKSFMNFVDRVLFLHNRTGIENFCLKCGERVDSRRVCGWLSAANVGDFETAYYFCFEFSRFCPFSKSQDSSSQVIEFG